MSSTRDLPISPAHLKRLISQARHDLKQARWDDDTHASRRAERRMNALLDQLAHEGHDDLSMIGSGRQAQASA